MSFNFHVCCYAFQDFFFYMTSLWIEKESDRKHNKLNTKYHKKITKAVKVTTGCLGSFSKTISARNVIITLSSVGANKSCAPSHVTLSLDG